MFSFRAFQPFVGRLGRPALLWALALISLLGAAGPTAADSGAAELEAMALATNYGQFSGATVMGAPLPRRSTSLYDAASGYTFFVYPAGAAIPCNDWSGTCSPSTSTLRVFDNVTNTWLAGSLAVGDAIAVADGHAYPVITITQDGHVHVFSGGHGTPLVHRVSTLPSDDSTWDPLDALDWEAGTLPDDDVDRATYPLVFLKNPGQSSEELFLFWRQSHLLMDETCGSLYFDPDGNDCVGKTYDPVYYSRWYRPSGSNDYVWSDSTLLIDPAPFAWVWADGQPQYLRSLDGWDRIYVNGVKVKGRRLLLSFSKTYKDNQKTGWHHFAVFDFVTRRIYPPTNYKTTGGSGEFDTAGGVTTLKESVFDQTSKGYRYYQQPAGFPGRRGSVAVDEDPTITRPQIFQSVVEDMLTCASCNEEPQSNPTQTPKRSIRHFSWQSGTSSWTSTRYFTNKTDASKPIINPDPLEVTYDTHPGNGVAYRFHLLVAWEQACKTNLTTRTCLGSTAQYSRCITTSSHGVSEWTKALSDMGQAQWTEDELLKASSPTTHRYKHFQRIPSVTGATPPDMKGVYFQGTIDNYFRGCSWQYPARDQTLKFWD